MAYTQHGEEYLVTKDGSAGDLYIPMCIINEAITRTADADFDAGQIEATHSQCNGSAGIT